jgi:hypothetical protein
MTAPAAWRSGYRYEEDAMSNPKQQPKPQTKATKPEKGALSDAALTKVSGGNMPTAVERGTGGGGGSGRS